MENIRQKLAEINYKTALMNTMKFIKEHNFTFWVLVAGFVIGFSLIRVKSLSDYAASPSEEVEVAQTQELDENGEPIAPKPEEPLVKIELSDETFDRLIEAGKDADVFIDSDLPENRTNPF